MREKKLLLTFYKELSMERETVASKINLFRCYYFKKR